jgi:alpha-D-xyloside xylohydrolase
MIGEGMHQKTMVPKRGFFNVALPALVVMAMGVQLVWGLSVTSHVQDNDGITCTCDAGVMKVKICRDDIVRVAYSPTSTIPNRSLKIVTNTWTPATPFTKTESGDLITLQTSRIRVKVSKSTANVTFTDLADAVILSEYSKSLTPVTVQGVSTYRVAGEWNSPADEGLYGLGQHQQNKVNYKRIWDILGQLLFHEF